MSVALIITVFLGELGKKGLSCELQKGCCREKNDIGYKIKW